MLIHQKQVKSPKISAVFLGEGLIVHILRHFGNLNFTYYGNFGSRSIYTLATEYWLPEYKLPEFKRVNLYSGTSIHNLYSGTAKIWAEAPENRYGWTLPFLFLLSWLW